MDVGVSVPGEPAGGARSGSAGDEGRARDLLVRLFAGFGLSPGSHLDKLIGRFVARAAVRRGGEGTDGGLLALAAAEAELEAWFALVLGEAAEKGGDALLVGRATWRACGAVERWPEALLAPEPPRACVETLRAALRLPVPPEQPGTMTEQPFEAWALRDLAPKPGIARLLPRRSAPA